MHLYIPGYTENRANRQGILIRAGDWRRVESTVFTKSIALFIGPKGVKIKHYNWLWSNDEQTLDGVNIKQLVLGLGEVQVWVPRTMRISYWFGSFQDFEGQWGHVINGVPIATWGLRARTPPRSHSRHRRR